MRPRARSCSCCPGTSGRRLPAPTRKDMTSPASRRKYPPGRFTTTCAAATSPSTPWRCRSIPALAGCCPIPSTAWRISTPRCCASCTTMPFLRSLRGSFAPPACPPASIGPWKSGQARYDAARENNYIENIADRPRGHEIEQLAHEDDPLAVMKALEKEGWLQVLAPHLSQSKVDAAGLSLLFKTR